MSHWKERETALLNMIVLAVREKPKDRKELVKLIMEYGNRINPTINEINRLLDNPLGELFFGSS